MSPGRRSPVVTTENPEEDAVRVGPGNDFVFAADGHVDIIDYEINIGASRYLTVLYHPGCAIGPFIAASGALCQNRFSVSGDRRIFDVRVFRRDPEASGAPGGVHG